jgi:hypothetical protein
MFYLAHLIPLNVQLKIQVFMKKGGSQ